MITFLGVGGVHPRMPEYIEELEEASDELEQLKEVVEELKEEVAGLVVEKEQFADKIKRLIQEACGHLADKANLLEKVRALERELETEKNKYKHAEDVFSQVAEANEATIQDYLNKNLKLISELEERGNKQQELLQEACGLIADKANLQEKVKRLESDLETEKNKYKRAESIFEQALEAVDEIQEKVKDKCCITPVCMGATHSNWCDDCIKKPGRSQHASYPFKRI